MWLLKRATQSRLLRLIPTKLVEVSRYPNKQRYHNELIRLDWSIITSWKALQCTQLYIQKYKNPRTKDTSRSQSDVINKVTHATWGSLPPDDEIND